MLVLSHRGLHAKLPENTLEAFRAAAALEVDGIETDVRLDAEGTAILHHDPHARDGTDVAELTRREISQRAGYEVPTLDEAVQALDLLWNLEIKVPAALPAVLDLVQRLGATRRLVVTSFWHPVIRRFAGRVPVACGVLVAHRPLRLGNYPGTVVVWHHEVLDRAMVAAAVARRRQVWVYGPQTPGEHRRCVELGVDAVITDWPQVALAMRGRGGEWGSESAC